MIPWASARPRARARKLRLRKALEKVEKAECGPALEITEVIGCRPERRSKELVDSLSHLSTNTHIRGIMLGKALNQGPN